MKVLFFGDSFTSGENNNFTSYVEKLELSDYVNYGVSGTTFGNYSIYPVGENDFLSQIHKHEIEIESADIICFEYGINDATSYMLGYVNKNQVILDIIKSLDYIKQLNPKAKLIYLQVSDLDNCLDEIYKAQVEYLEEEYLKDVYEVLSNKNDWKELIKTQNCILSGKVDKKIVLIDNKSFFDNYIDIDKIHPNDKGYEIISNKIRKELLDEGINYWSK